MLEIVKMKETFIAEVLEVERICFSTPWGELAIASELYKENALMFCAVVDNKVVGWAGIEYVFEGADVTNVAVIPNYRGQKIGEKLTERLIEEAVNLKLENIMLEVRVSNVVAIALYEKLGFISLGIRPSYYEKPKEDAMMMMMQLI